MRTPKREGKDGGGGRGGGRLEEQARTPAGQSGSSIPMA